MRDHNIRGGLVIDQVIAEIAAFGRVDTPQPPEPFAAFGLGP